MLGFAVNACGGGAHGLAAETPVQILRASLQAAAGARSVRIVGAVPAFGVTQMAIDEFRRGAIGNATFDGVHVKYRVLGEAEYVSGTLPPGTELLGATIPWALTVGWIRLDAPSPRLATISSMTAMVNRLAR